MGILVYIRQFQGYSHRHTQVPVTVRFETCVFLVDSDFWVPSMCIHGLLLVTKI